MKRRKTTNIQFPRSDFPSTSVSKTEDSVINNRRSDDPVPDKIADEPSQPTDHNDSGVNVFSIGEEGKTKTIFNIKKQRKSTRVMNDTDNSENSSEEKGSYRKDRKPLPLIFNQSRSSHTDNNDSSSDTSEDTKETDSHLKCVYLGERETLRSFWDKCLYQCFKSKRCVAGEKPKRKYRKKPKLSKLSTKKRKPVDVPLSCIDTMGTAVTHKGWCFLIFNFF